MIMCKLFQHGWFVRVVLCLSARLTPDELVWFGVDSVAQMSSWTGKTGSSLKPGCTNVLQNWLRFSLANLNMVYKIQAAFQGHNQSEIRTHKALIKKHFMNE